MKASLLLLFVIGVAMVSAYPAANEKEFDDLHKLEAALKSLLQDDEKEMEMESRDTKGSCMRATDNCNGHGTCVEGRWGDYYCKCDSSYKVGGSESSCYINEELAEKKQDEKELAEKELDEELAEKEQDEKELAEKELNEMMLKENDEEQLNEMMLKELDKELAEKEQDEKEQAEEELNEMMLKENDEEELNEMMLKENDEEQLNEMMLKELDKELAEKEQDEKELAEEELNEMMLKEKDEEQLNEMALKEKDEKEMEMESRDTRGDCIRATNNCNDRGTCVEGSSGAYYCRCAPPYTVGGPASSCISSVFPFKKEEDKSQREMEILKRLVDVLKKY